MPNKSCFISYAHEGIDRDTLDYLLYILKEHLLDGTQILIDQNLRYGQDFTEFMRLLDEVDVVVLILTPAYKKSVVDRKGGVYEEFGRIWARYSGQKTGGEPNRKNDFELIPILFSGRMQDSTPEEIISLKQLDLTRLRVTRKATGEFHIAQHMQQSFVPQIEKLAGQIHAAALVKSDQFEKLSLSYYDRLFVDLKASFDDSTFAGHDYLNTILVKTSTYRRIESQLAYVVIGRKGSGKSTLTQVLPLIHPDRYQGIVRIVADEFNLETLFSLYSDQQFRSDASAAVSRDQAFEFTWEALIILSIMEMIQELGKDKQLSSVQLKLMPAVEALFLRIKGDPHNSVGANWRTGDLFNFAFSATMEFVKDCIDGARSEQSVFLADIGARFNRERYLVSVLGADALESFRKIIRTITKRFVITLDGFDTAFDRFRRESIRLHDEDKLRRRAHFEVDWLRSLLGLALEAKAKRQDYFYSCLDFCIAAPKDRFMEVIRVERDSYRQWQRWCTLNWTGIELAILLRKRLEVLVNYKTDSELSPEERLEEVLKQKLFRTLPAEIEFDYNDRSYKMPTFFYVLRHTFWRPRDVLVYYAALLALAEEMKRWGYGVTSDVVRKCVKATTRQVIESEFINEFHSTVLNIRDILRAFKKRKISIPYSVLSEILLPLDFKFASGSLEKVGLFEKIRFLYDIGFLGIKAGRSMKEQFGIDLDYAFYFNEGSSMFLGTDEDEMDDWDFVIHPIFSEYLRLDTQGQELTLQFSWDYLHQREAFFTANPNA